MDVSIVIRGGRTRKRVVKLAEGEKLIFGRGVNSNIQIFDKELSRTHCQLENISGNITAVDLQSSNGTFLNNKQIHRETAKYGDVIKIGGVFLELQKPTGFGTSDTSLAFYSEENETSFAQIKKKVDVDRFAQPGTRAIKKQEDYERIQRELQAIYKVGNAINAENNIDKLFKVIAESILDVIQADRASLLLKDKKTGEVQPRTIHHREGIRQDPTLSVSRTVVEQSIENGLSTLSSDAMSDDRFKSGMSIIMQQIKSVMCVPLLSQDKILGAIYVDSNSAVDVFTEADLDLLAAIGNQAGIAVQRVSLFEELESMFVGSVRMISASLDAKDHYTYGHSERVTAFSLRIGEMLNLSEKEQEEIWLAGQLHDVGKIGIAEAILNKNSRLTDEEFAQIKTHPVIGSDIIKHIPNISQNVYTGVRHHHERWDGSGYPDKLKGEASPLFARILGVADAFDAITTERPYQKARSDEEAVAILKENSGTQFDPKIAEIFSQCYVDGRMNCEKSIYKKYYIQQPEEK